jgi:hypothetical protein
MIRLIILSLLLLLSTLFIQTVLFGQESEETPADTSDTEAAVNSDSENMDEDSSGSDAPEETDEPESAPEVSTPFIAREKPVEPRHFWLHLEASLLLKMQVRSTSLLVNLIKQAFFQRQHPYAEYYSFTPLGMNRILENPAHRPIIEVSVVNYEPGVKFAYALVVDQFRQGEYVRTRAGVRTINLTAIPERFEEVNEERPTSDTTTDEADEDDTSVEGRSEQEGGVDSDLPEMEGNEQELIIWEEELARIEAQIAILQEHHANQWDQLRKEAQYIVERILRQIYRDFHELQYRS